VIVAQRLPGHSHKLTQVAKAILATDLYSFVQGAFPSYPEELPCRSTGTSRQSRTS
jgi:hypothetical protein